MKRLSCLCLSLVLLLASSGTVMASTVDGEVGKGVAAVEEIPEEHVEEKDGNESSAVEKPSVTEEPSEVEEPSVTEEPSEAEEPSATEEPSVTEESSGVEEPSVTEALSVSDGQETAEVPEEEPEDQQPVDETVFSVQINDGTVKEYVAEDGDRKSTRSELQSR